MPTDTEAFHWDKMYAVAKGATWHSNPDVLQYIQRRQSGKDIHWLGYIFQEYLTDKPKRVLSIGCGDGSHELSMARAGLAENIHAFDASSVGIAKAMEISKSENLNINFFVDTFENFSTSKFEEKFDVIMFVGSLHHVDNMNWILSAVRDALTPDGKVIYNEYVGPCYISFPPERVALINKILTSIPDEFKVEPNIQWRNPHIEEIERLDPTEARRSALIPQFLRLYFDVELEKEFGGGLLHPIFQLLNVDRLAVMDSGAKAVTQMLICIEQILEDEKIIPSDFVIGVCRHKSSTHADLP